MSHSPADPKVRLSLFGLHASVLLLSFTSVFAKLAAGRPMFSFSFFVFYGAVIAILGIYSVIWQRILTHVKLSVAYISRSLVVLWVFLWSLLFFGETITTTNMIGGTLIICGVYFAGTR